MSLVYFRELSEQELSLLNIEERIQYRQQQWFYRQQKRHEYEQQEIERIRTAAKLSAEQAKMLQKQRQAANHAERAAENQRLRSIRSGRSVKTK